MKPLIIGHRGFVGSNLSRQIPEAVGAGRAEIGALVGQTFNDIYCAAPQAKKWWANQNPEQDRQEVNALIDICSKLSCKGTFILFSTVDIYDPPLAVDERNQPLENTHPYGRHRFTLEKSILDQFGEQARVIRLPALVGHGLKKNIVYDLLNSNNVELVNPNSAFQWFNLDYLTSIIDLAKRLQGGQILNVASEPLATKLILETWFADVMDRLNCDAEPMSYDVRTVYGSDGKPYLYSANEALSLHLKPYIESQRVMR